MDFGLWVLGFGFWALDFGSGLLIFSGCLLDLGFGILGFGFWGVGFRNLKGLGLKFTGSNTRRSRQWVMAEDESCRGFTLCSDVPKRLSDRSRAASRLARAHGLDFRAYRI